MGPKTPRSTTVPAELEGRPLDGVVRTLFGGSWGEARARIASGKVAVDGQTCSDAGLRVRSGMALALDMRAPKRREGALPDAAIVYLDAHVVVVDKPAGLSTVPYDEGERGTLDERVRDWLRKSQRGGSPRPALGVVHRLDKETSGLLVFTRTWLAKKSLSSQFRAHTVERRYLAIAHGEVRAETLRSRLVADRGDGLRGSLRPGARGGREEGQLAVTHVEVVEALKGATLIACRLETGRTHQIRIHLSEAGHPIVGERVYVRRFAGAIIPAPRLMLHAAELGFVHPATQGKVCWEVPPPPDFAGVREGLRARG
jgi:23S rRNA pseudouridine1911/1915/1917 synthase